jgi:hypothetical protein
MLDMFAGAAGIYRAFGTLSIFIDIYVEEQK